jgi:transposase-like protein
MKAPKRTWKRRQLGRDQAEIERVLRGSKSQAEAARKLGVNRSTASRWLKALGPPQTGNVVALADHRAPAPPSDALTDPDAWERWMREEYVPTPTQAHLIRMAAEAARIANDPESRAADKLAAMGRFQRLVQQLGIEDEEV